MVGPVLLLALNAAVQADTTVAMNRGDRVVIEGVSGVIAITTWNRDELELRSDASPNAAVTVRRTGASVQVEAEGPRRRRSVDAAIRLPAWADLEVGGTSLDLSVTGLDGAIRVVNVSGDLLIRDAAGPVDVRSIRGAISVVDARGGVRASSQADNVSLQRVSGPVEAHSGDGDIVLDAIASRSVRVEAQDGDVFFSGQIETGGEYGFYLHDGDATIAVQPSVSAAVSVSTFDGEFTSDFPVRVERFSAGRQFEFVLGNGGARIEIEVFDGEIHLARGGVGAGAGAGAGARAGAGAGGQPR